MKKLILFLLAFLAAPAAAQNSPCYWGPNNLVRCFKALSGISLAGQQVLQFGDATTNYVQIQAPSAVTTYTLTLPTSQGGVGTYLRNDGTGVLSWAAASGSGAAGTVTSVGTGTGLTGGPITSSGVISLVTPVALANGGTGQTTAQASMDALAGAQSAGKYLRSDGTHTTLQTIQAADVPTLNQNTTGTAANITGTLAIANGGTGQGTAAAAFNALSPLTTLGDLLYGGASGAGTRLAGPTSSTKQFLTSTGNGTVAAAPTWSTIQAADVPTLNQNTTGTAANVTGVVAIANGGTGQTTSQAAINALSQLTAKGDLEIFDGTNSTRFPVGTDGQVLSAQSGHSGGLQWISGIATNPMTTLGDIIYGGSGGAENRLAGNTTSTRNFLISTGSAGVAAAPVWGALAASDLPVVTQSAAGAVASAGQLLGTNTNDDASSGNVGQSYYSTNSTVNPGTGVYADLTSQSFDKGDWDVTWQVVFGLGSGATSSYAEVAISTTSGNSSTGLTLGNNDLSTAGPTQTNDASLTIAQFRISLAAPTIYYFKVRTAYSGGNMTCYWSFRARRVR